MGLHQNICDQSRIHYQLKKVCFENKDLLIYIDQLIEQLIITDVQLFIQTSIFKNTVNKLGKLYRKRKHDKYIFT